MKIKFARMAATGVVLGMLLGGCSGGPAELPGSAVTASSQPPPDATKTPVAGKQLKTVSLVETETAGLTFQTDPVVDGMMRATVSCQGQGRLSIVIKSVDGSSGTKMKCDAQRGKIVIVGGVATEPDGLQVKAQPSGGVRWWLRVENCAEGHCPQLTKKP